MTANGTLAGALLNVIERRSVRLSNSCLKGKTLGTPTYMRRLQKCELQFLRHAGKTHVLHIGANYWRQNASHVRMSGTNHNGLEHQRHAKETKVSRTRGKAEERSLLRGTLGGDHEEHIFDESLNAMSLL